MTTLTTPGAATPVEARPTGRDGTGRGRPTVNGSEARWARPALLGLLLATGVLYLWGLGRSGWANAFYSAAAQAGSQSWKAFFFGSSDASNSITVDKTPASLWLMALSVRLFGLSSWSILVPQALAGVASVGVLYASVKRWFGPAAGLIAGAVLALTPVAVLMFRFNNPDAMLVLLLVCAAYAVTRAVENASTRWLVLAGALVGFGFLTKMLQALLVVPSFGAVYLLAAPTSLRRRIGQLLLAGLAVVAAGGWWVAIVELIPAQYRPYIGGSQTNSVLELALGYNGLGRLTGQETGSVGGGLGWGQTGWLRLLGADVGGQAAWLLPASLILLGAGLWLTTRAPRTDRTRAALVLWGGWLLVTAAVFSFMQGIFHPYYTVALAPAIGALVGIGATLLWRRRGQLPVATVLAGTLALTAWWAAVLLGRSPTFVPWLRVVVLVVGFGAAAALLFASRLPRRAATVLAAVGLLTALAGPTAYALDTAATPHTGAIPSAGPTVAGVRGGPDGVGAPAGAGGFGALGAPPGTATDGTARRGTLTAPPFGGGGPAGGLLGSSNPGAALAAMLQVDAGRYTWAAATVGANGAAGYQLASGQPVMPIGGFNGSDPSPTLAQFQQWVAEGKIHYFLGGGMGGGRMRSDGGSNASQQIAEWVAANFTAQTVDGITVYDLTASTS